MEQLPVVLLETKRLYFKGLTPENKTAVFRDNSKAEIMALLGHRNEKEYLAEEFKQKNGYATYNRRFLLFLLIEKNSKSIIGRCGLHNWNKQHRRAEIGYVLYDERYRRQGLMNEAVEAILLYGFETLQLHRIEALVGEENTASLRILQKFGFVQEGVLRQHIQTATGAENSIIYALLRNSRAHS